MISMSLCKKLLGIIWVLGFVPPLLLLIYMTVNNSLQDTNATWGWFFPTMLPTVSLIVAVFVSEALTNAEDKYVSGFIFTLACVFSIIYIFIVITVVLYIPRATSPTQLTGLLKNTNLYLGPIQALVTGVLGVFFVNKGTRTQR